MSPATAASSPPASGTTAAAPDRSARSGRRCAREGFDVDDESTWAGAREGHLAQLLDEAGLAQIEDTALSVGVEHATFDDWWDPYTLGVGPAGAFLAGLDETQRAQLRQRCESLLPEAPFTVTARAWAARGRRRSVAPIGVFGVEFPAPATRLAPVVDDEVGVPNHGWLVDERLGMDVGRKRCELVSGGRSERQQDVAAEHGASVDRRTQHRVVRTPGGC